MADPRGRHGALTGPVHDNGHGLDHDRGRRGPRALSARRFVHPGRRLGPSPHGGRQRIARRRDGAREPQDLRHRGRIGGRSLTPSALSSLSAGRPMPSSISSPWRDVVMWSWTFDDFDRLSRLSPVLANIRPGGEYLMEDFYYAGGLPALMAQIRDLPPPRADHGQRAQPGREHLRGRGA